MKKLLAVLVVSLVVSGCTLSPPPPPEAKDDGRGMVPINPDKVTMEQINAVASRHKEVNKKAVISLKEFVNGR